MYNGQHLQDKFLEENIFKGFRDGFFVDVGAHDGVEINNTFFFEKERGWTGINVEPLDHVYPKLAMNRPHCINIHAAVDETDGQAEFVVNRGYTEMLSGLQRHYPVEHAQRLDSELRAHGGSSEKCLVPTKRLSSIFAEHGVTHVHLLSVDVEGAELAVLRSIDFDKVFVDVIVFEANYGEYAQSVVEFLGTKNYVPIHSNGLDVFVIHRHSQFLPRNHA
jgi:FkbM family methyltransferase